MRHAVLISGRVPWPLELASAWRRAGDDVSVVLLDAAVTAARGSSADAGIVRAAIDAGVTISAEAGALRRRGITEAALADGVKVCDYDEVADSITEGAERVVWL